jgi:hypothetical protein
VGGGKAAAGPLVRLQEGQPPLEGSHHEAKATGMGNQYVNLNSSHLWRVHAG